MPIDVDVVTDEGAAQERIRFGLVGQARHPSPLRHRAGLLRDKDNFHVLTVVEDGVAAVREPGDRELARSVLIRNGGEVVVAALRDADRVGPGVTHIVRPGHVDLRLLARKVKEVVPTAIPEHEHAGIAVHHGRDRLRVGGNAEVVRVENPPNGIGLTSRFTTFVGPGVVEPGGMTTALTVNTCAVSSSSPSICVHVISVEPSFAIVTSENWMSSSVPEMTMGASHASVFASHRTALISALR